MELKGTVTLDDETMEALQKDVREEVLAEIKKDGLHLNEVLPYLKECDYKDYCKLLSQTLNGVVERTDPETITRNNDIKEFRKLQAIRDVWLL